MGFLKKATNPLLQAKELQSHSGCKHEILLLSGTIVRVILKILLIYGWMLKNE